METVKRSQYKFCVCVFFFCYIYVWEQLNNIRSHFQGQRIFVTQPWCGIAVLCNLHTLDTARVYCRRIIGMAAGRIVFDGAPDALTEDTLRDIYGAEEEEIDERITSTSLPLATRPVLARG